ncbi:GGDEF domain-containing protein [Micromonospora chokoriensis]|uniref:Diguanylate cyclase (GGDEF) domain-containing protein n=1 Tax=Micromonospora chokoriensis TaxID=356851 RepID=A0A1C4UL67_9ACTN|nr:GGDEF domain-containing protein [Micromonospora chokoriensis]SCE72400.1 diguanylate cyclase (GGDEF) domain-containing protein [Micromonospora chokoriensis]
MTLRGRLTAAFLVVVLGPVLLGTLFVASTVAAVDRSRSTERLAVAASAVRTSVDALCQQLRATADAVALTADPAVAAAQLVGRGLAAAVLITDVTGNVSYVSPGAPTAPWRDCSGPTNGETAGPAEGGTTGPTNGETAGPVRPVRALAAQVDLRDRSGTLLGTVTAAHLVDPAFVARLAAVTGVAVTLLDSGASAARVTHTTESREVRDAVLAAASTVDGERVTETTDGRYVRRIGPSDAQPLPLVLSVPSELPPGLHATLAGVVVLAALLAVLSAWRLARVTTRPLVELAGAVDRVAQGDLTARVPVRSRDELGRLAAAFNRMTRETGSYVAALTSNRDQLRGHLGVLGDTLASTHDLQRILRVILHSAIGATGARAGAVLLVETGGVLVAQCTEGLDGRWPEDDPDGPSTLRVPVGVGVVGAVAATGEPQRGRMEPAEAPSGEPRCRTYVAVPFAAPGGAAATPAAPSTPTDDTNAAAALGVLALYDRLGADEFDDDDLVTLRTFAGHAAVAVDNVRVHEEAQRLSLTDPLTGLWNYRYLRESIRREVERASRFGRMLSILALDLDRFKDVNDTYGHAAGDTVLAEFARRVRGEIREVDLAFRQGGEEFVLLLPETDARGAAIVAERLGAVVRETPIAVEADAGPVVVTVSVGIAVYPDNGSTGREVLEAADDALYAAKAAGRDTYRVAEVRPDVVTRELPVLAGAATPSDGLPRAGQHVQVSREPGGSARSESAVCVPESSPAGATHAGPDPADDPPDSAGAGPDAARPGSGGGASSGPHPPRQSRGR